MTAQELLERLQLLDETERIEAKAGLTSKRGVLTSNPGALSSNPAAQASKAETVRQDCLRPLLRAGRIAMTRPDKPNDPEQAYQASTTE